MNNKALSDNTWLQLILMIAILILGSCIFISLKLKGLF